MLESPIFNTLRNLLSGVFVKWALIEQTEGILPRVYWSSDRQDGMVVFFDIWLDKRQCEWKTDTVILPDDPIVLGGIGIRRHNKLEDRSLCGITFWLFPEPLGIKVSSVIRNIDKVSAAFEIMMLTFASENVFDKYTDNKLIEVDLSSLFTPEVTQRGFA